MAVHRPARAPRRRARASVLPALALLIAVALGSLLERSSATSGDGGPATVTAETFPAPAGGVFPPGPPDRLSGDRRGGLGVDDGLVPDGTTVFDDQYPAVAKLTPALRRAVRRAATDAARDGVTFTVESGWRSTHYQAELLRAAVSRYGSAEEAARWVATPETSAHVSGDAFDIGPSKAAAWLAKHGASYGLCQVYRNEPWHYELRADAVDRGCPRPYADPTHDPRMRP